MNFLISPVCTKKADHILETAGLCVTLIKNLNGKVQSTPITKEILVIHKSTMSTIKLFLKIRQLKKTKLLVEK